MRPFVMEIMEDDAWFVCMCVCVWSNAFVPWQINNFFIKTSADPFSQNKLYFAQDACVYAFEKQ